METCEDCGENRRDGAWVQTIPATHDSPAEHTWICHLCHDHADRLLEMSIDQSIHAALDGDEEKTVE